MVNGRIQTFKHHGKLGDVIYCLPAVIAMGGGVLYLSDGWDGLDIDESSPKPYGMTPQKVSELIDLLKTQPYLADVRRYRGEAVDCNLNIFRDRILNHHKDRAVMREHLSLWYLKAFKLKYDISRPWLINIRPNYISDIILHHNGRYAHSLNRFNWQALKKYQDKCTFIGPDEDYRKFSEHTGMIFKRYPACSILEMAEIIKGSKVFIGNQSLGFALAEAMKHPRVLEIWYFASNCMPQSCNGHLKLSERLIGRYLGKKKHQAMRPGLDSIVARARNQLFYWLVEDRISHFVAMKSRFKKLLLELGRIK